MFRDKGQRSLEVIEVTGQNLKQCLLHLMWKGQEKGVRGQNVLFTNISASTFTNKDSEPFNIIIDPSYGVFTDKGQPG